MALQRTLSAAAVVVLLLATHVLEADARCERPPCSACTQLRQLSLACRGADLRQTRTWRGTAIVAGLTELHVGAAGQKYNITLGSGNPTAVHALT